MTDLFFFSSFLLLHYQARGPVSPRVVRVMPNTPCLVGAAASAACAGTSSSSADDVVAVSAMMSAAGLCITVEERLMDAVVGVSGRGTVTSPHSYSYQHICPSTRHIMYIMNRVNNNSYYSTVTLISVHQTIKKEQLFYLEFIY